MYKIKILIVDDDPDILDLLQITLEDIYEIIQAATGKEALEKAEKESPDLLILDYSLPDIQGPQISETLRQNPHFLHTPILMLTGKGEVEDKVRGLEAGIDDYMVKPFAPQELIARLRMLIRRSNINLDANPLTRLPGNVTINSELEKIIKKQDKFAVLYIDLDHFKALNDYYGFEKGDEIIKEIARILIESVQDKGTVHDFVGHIGGDDFVIITTLDNAEEIAKQIISEIDKAAPNFFEEADRLKGYFETKDRDGKIHKFGFLTLSIGIITNEERAFSHIGEISSVGAELKKLAKMIPESNYVFERRTV